MCDLYGVLGEALPVGLDQRVAHRLPQQVHQVRVTLVRLLHRICLKWKTNIYKSGTLTQTFMASAPNFLSPSTMLRRSVRGEGEGKGGGREEEETEDGGRREEGGDRGRRKEEETEEEEEGAPDGHVGLPLGLGVQGNLHRHAGL